MRNVIYKIAACSALVALVLSGCKESFLEEDPNGYISSDQIKENAVWNPNIMLGQALGTYSTTFAWQTGGTTNHDDFGQKSIDIATDLMTPVRMRMASSTGMTKIRPSPISPV